jgi:hypothetical protein
MVVIETYRVHKLDIYVFLVRYQNYSTKNGSLIQVPYDRDHDCPYNSRSYDFMTMIVYETGDVNLAEAILVSFGLCFTRVYVLSVWFFLPDIKTIRLKTGSRQIIFFLSRTINNISEKDK